MSALAKYSSVSLGSFVMLATSDSCTHAAKKSSSSAPAAKACQPPDCGGTASAAGTIWNAILTSSSSSPPPAAAAAPLPLLLPAAPFAGGARGRGTGASSPSAPASGSSIIKTSYLPPKSSRVLAHSAS